MPFRFLKSLGPGLITASVVIGPGSIVASSKAGAHYGYSLIWLLALAAFFMGAFTLMAARIGCAADQSILTLTARKLGRPVAALVGVSSFLVVAGFQFGNNLGVATAMEGLTGLSPLYWPPFFTAVSLAMLFGFRSLYRPLEVLMKILVGTMVLSFLANLVFAGIHPIEFLRGWIPSLPDGSLPVARGLFPTTFSVVAALYAAHLVQEKKWKGTDRAAAQRDAIIGIGVLCFISLTILSNAAGAFHGRGDVTVETAGDLAAALDALFGDAARFIFCFGLAAAAFSSFLINALIGGGLLVDGLGFDRSIDRTPVKIATTAALLTGMCVALLVLAQGSSPATSILLAQASTLLAVPICAGVLLILANDRSLLGEETNGVGLNLVGAAGLATLCWMTWNTASSLWTRFAGS